MEAVVRVEARAGRVVARRDESCSASYKDAFMINVASQPASQPALSIYAKLSKTFIDLNIPSIQLQLPQPVS